MTLLSYKRVFPLNIQVKAWHIASIWLSCFYLFVFSFCFIISESCHEKWAFPIIRNSMVFLYIVDLLGKSFYINSLILPTIIETIS